MQQLTSPCRLMYVIGQLRPGGAEQQLCYLLERMDRERYRPVVIVWNFQHTDAYTNRIRELNVPLYGFHQTTSRLSKLMQFRRIARSLKPEVLHSYSFYTNFAVSWAVLGMQAIPIGSVRSDFMRARRDSGYFLGRFSGLVPLQQIFNSVASAENSRRCGIFVPRRQFVVRNGIDLGRFASTPIRADRRPKVVAIGSLAPVKRWDRLLRLTSQLKNEGVEFLVQLAGDGNLRQMLTAEAHGLGLNGHLEFLGHSTDIPSLLAGARLLVHTSQSEGCPNVVMEAMAASRPVVATDAGDTRSLIEHGKTGFVVPQGEDDLLRKYIAMLINDRRLCEQMGAAGRAKAEREFSLDRLVTQTLAVYRTLGWKENP